MSDQWGQKTQGQGCMVLFQAWKWTMCLSFLQVCYFSCLRPLHCYSQSLRQKQAIDPSFMVQAYGPKTGTTLLYTHLCNEHLGPWVNGCDKFKISIVAKTFQDPTDEYHRGSHARQEDPTLPTWAYSHEAFIDAIVEWIISDNQVWLLIKIYLCCMWLLNYPSLLMLLEAQGCNLCFKCCMMICMIQTSHTKPTSEPVLVLFGMNTLQDLNMTWPSVFFVVVRIEY